MPAKRGSMNQGKGLYSTPDNPLPAARRVAPMAGPGSNADQKKVNSLLQKNHSQNESLRGKSGK